MAGKCVLLDKRFFAASFQIHSSIFYSTFSYHRASNAKRSRFYSQQHTRKKVHVSLSSKDVETFHECGVVCLRGFFGSEWITKVKRGIEKNIESPSKYSECLKSEIAGTSGGSYFNDYCNWKAIGEFQDYVVNSPAAEIAGKLMKSKVKKSFFCITFETQGLIFIGSCLP